MYEWDETKRAKNLANHGLDFALIEAFDWEQAIIEKDERRDYAEERYRALVYIGDRLHAAVFTIRLGNIRLISLRKANKREVLKWLAKQHHRQRPRITASIAASRPIRIIRNGRVRILPGHARQKTFFRPACIRPPSNVTGVSADLRRRPSSRTSSCGSIPISSPPSRRRAPVGNRG